MRILLIDPPYQTFTGYASNYFSLGLSYIAATLRAAGHEALILDVDAMNRGMDIDYGGEYKRLQQYLDGISDVSHPVWNEITEVLEDFAPDLVGITALTMKFGSVVRTAEVCKAYNPSLAVVVGGAHAKDWPEITLQSPHVDFNLGGEAEETILSLVAALANKDTSAFGDIPGLAYRSGATVIQNPLGDPPRDLDRIPMPARDLLMHPQSYTSEAMGVIMTSRGCPFNCAFCSHERSVRYRAIDRVVDEIKNVMDTYGTRQFAFKDDTFTTKRTRVMEFCQRLIDERLDINWDCTTRANLLDDELLDMMTAAGCNVIKIGVETGSERILKDVNKGVTFEEMRKAAKLLNRHGIFWSAYFMYGLPSETADDMRATYRFMKELNPFYAGLGLYAPYPNTALWRQGIAMGLVDPEVGIDHFFSTNPKDYFFKDPAHRVANMSAEEFEQMADYMAEAFHRHNTQVRSLLRRGWARRKIYLRDLGLLLSDSGKALRWLSQ